MTNVGTKVRTVGLLVAGAALAIAGPASSALAVVPADGGALIDFMPITIDAGPGDQLDPHVSGDLASYTSDWTVRYYDFFTGSGALVPQPAGATAALSDVSGGRIAFSRFEASGRAPIVVFDTGTATGTEVDAMDLLPLRMQAAIGGDTVAFIDMGVEAAGEVYASVLGSPSVRLTDDAAADQSPAVAQTGDVIAWESCVTACDIHRAVRSGAGWTITALTATPGPEANPDTDGTFVVYDATRDGERDIRWQPVGGGPEQVLELPGEQRDPSIADGVILFQSVAVGDTAADLFVYEIATNRSFRATSTPADEVLSDLAALPDGRMRIVWTAGAIFAHDVFGATFRIPPPPPAYGFGGFLQPVDPLPALNSLKAGAAVPVRFSLGGDRGPDVFAAGYPRSAPVACDTTLPVDAVEETVSAGGSALTYDPLTDVYTYVWKTDGAWAGSCRQLVLAFADGSIQRANFKLR